MEIIKIDEYSHESSDSTPTGTLYFTTKTEANSYTDLANWGNGTVCYTKSLEVGVLDNGTWNWV